MPKSLKESKYMPAILIGLAVLCVGGGIVFFITGSQNAVAYRRVLMNICGGLMVFLSLLLLYLLYLTRDAEPNFFLYDPQKRRNIQPDKLTFSIVNGRMNFFISQIVRDKNDLWLTDVLLQNNRFGYRGVYKPLVAYKMIFDLVDIDSEAGWRNFSQASGHVITILRSALEQNKEMDLSAALKHFYENDTDKARLRDFLMGNKKYLQGKMLAYVKKNLELFY